MVNDTASLLMLILGLDLKVYQVKNLPPSSLKNFSLAITPAKIPLLVSWDNATASLAITHTTLVVSSREILDVMSLLPCPLIPSLSEPFSQLEALSMLSTARISVLAMTLNYTSTLPVALVNNSAFAFMLILTLPKILVFPTLKPFISPAFTHNCELIHLMSSVSGSLLRITSIVHHSLLLILLVLELLARMAVHATTEYVSAQLRMLAVLSAKSDGLHVPLRASSAHHGALAMKTRLPALVNSAIPAISVNILPDAV
jgi:hypothetical protein